MNARFSRLALLLILLLASAVVVGAARGRASGPILTEPDAAAPIQQATTDQIGQHGVTWTFDQEYTYGQFANGDYWVVGPLTITAIDPPSTDTDGRVINGSMRNPSPLDGSVQGYDSAMYGSYGPDYDPALNVGRPNGQDLSAGNPLVLPAGSSLVSSISLPEAGARPQLQTAAVLTVLEAAPPAGSFRPPYSGSDKTILYNLSQISPTLLAQLEPVPSTPDWADVERYFERPWIDHVPNWLSDYHHPEENMPHYGREMAAQVGAGALMLHLDVPYAQKETLLVRYLQLGIDLYGVARDGGEQNWVPNGGHTSGRKWPILFAGLVLGDQDMKNIGPGDGTGTVAFGEDGQTFYVAPADVAMAHDPDLRGCYLLEYEQDDLGLPEWGIRHSTEPDQDNKAWCAIYRQCCTANAWTGFVLAVHIMDVQEVWDHDPLFDYQDRYMAAEEPGTWMRSWDDFSEEMWDAYRYDYPPVWPALALRAQPADRTIALDWTVQAVLPLTTSWRIHYYSQTGTLPLTWTSPLSSTGAHTLTGLTNYAWYTITLNAVLDGSPFLTDTVRAMPTDIWLYLPLLLKGE